MSHSDEFEISAASRTAHQDNTSHHDDDGFLDKEEEEEIREWNLRFLFHDHKFGGPVWLGLQDAGFTYHGGPYHSPKLTSLLEDGTTKQEHMTFKDGKDICQFLDRFCIPPIQNTLQLPPENPLSGLSSEEIRRGRELREIVVRHVYKRMVTPRNGTKQKKGEKSETTSKNTSKVDTRSTRRQTRKSASTRTEATAPPPMKRRFPKRQCTRRPHQPTTETTDTTTTATAFEKGADTFLRKSRQKQKVVSSQDLAFLKFPTVAECVQQHREAFTNDGIEEIEKDYEDNFDDWRFLLTTRNSLLVYGHGSKRHVLDSFARNKLEREGDVLTIDGFDRDVRIESILDLLVNLFLDGKEPDDGNELVDHESYCHDRVDVTAAPPSMIGTHNVVRRATRISKSLAIQQLHRRQPLYLVIHSVDGPCLQSRTVQEALASLVAHSTIVNTHVNAIRMIASIDHVNASALLWDNRTCSNFSWIWKEVHTYRPYVEELSFGLVEDERKRQRSKKRRANDIDDATLWSVLASLAPRHAEVVKILATLQSEDLKPVDHVALLHSCKHRMTVTNDSTLRAYLNELSDHGIVEKGKDSSTGKEWLRIPHSREKLLEIRDFEMDK